MAQLKSIDTLSAWKTSMHGYTQLISSFEKVASGFLTTILPHSPSSQNVQGKCTRYLHVVQCIARTRSLMFKFAKIDSLSLVFKPILFMNR